MILVDIVMYINPLKMVNLLPYNTLNFENSSERQEALPLVPYRRVAQDHAYGRAISHPPVPLGHALLISPSNFFSHLLNLWCRNCI